MGWACLIGRTMLCVKLVQPRFQCKPSCSSRLGTFVYDLRVLVIRPGGGCTTYLFESNCLTPFSTRCIRQIVHEYAAEVGIEKAGLPYLFRQQIFTYLTCKGFTSPELKCVVKLEKRNSRELRHGLMAVSERLPCRIFRLR